jgi:hypothetical protein
MKTSSNIFIYFFYILLIYNNVNKTSSDFFHNINNCNNFVYSENFINNNNNENKLSCQENLINAIQENNYKDLKKKYLKISKTTNEEISQRKNELDKLKGLNIKDVSLLIEIPRLGIIIIITTLFTLYFNILKKYINTILN